MCISNAFLGDCIIFKVCLPYIRALHFRLLFINQRLDLTLQTSLLQQFATETQFRYRKLKPSFYIGNRKPSFCTGNQNLFFYVSHLFWYWDLKPRSNFGTYRYLSQHIFCYFFSNVFKISHFLGYGHFGFQHFAETKIVVSVVDCVAAQVMSLGFSADFMWLNKLKTSEKARVFQTLMTYL